MARSGRARCWLPTDSTRAISPSATVLPFTSIDAEMSSLPGFHSARHDMTVSDHLDRMGPPAQSILWRLRFEPRNQAHDLAGADVKRANQRRPFWRKRPGLRCLAELENHAHALPPFFAGGFFSLSASARDWAAPGASRTVTRSGSLKSMCRISREVSFASRSKS